MSRISKIEEIIRAEAYNLGFVLCGFSAAQTPRGYEHYLRWLEAGYHAEMTYLQSPNAVAAREHPEALLAGCRTVISLAMAYAPVVHHLELGDTVPVGRIAAYATYPDYHEVFTDSLHALVSRLETLSSHTTFVAVDTAPILEKEFAVSAGLGWIGRNSLLTNPRYGSWLLLGEILTTLELEPNREVINTECQNCQRCVMACPTKAIRPDFSIDARRCLSYLTIEHRGAIPEYFRELMGNRIFGCDTCQTACPHNRDLTSQPSTRFGVGVIDPEIDLFESLLWSEAEFKKRFADTPVLRAKYFGWRRNVAIALGNSNNPHAIPVLQEALSQESNQVVREALKWSLAQFDVFS